MVSKQSAQRTVLISDPHIYSDFARYGAQQYANVFAHHGWKVVLLSGSFNLGRLFSPSGISQGHIGLWRKRGRRIYTNITNYSLAHLLPAQLRFRRPLSSLAHALYIPSPKSILRAEGIPQVDLLWLNGCYDWLLRRSVPHSKLVVRIADNYSGFGAEYDNFHPLMRETLEFADAVFTCSEKVKELYRGLFKGIEVVPNGVDYEHFTRPIGDEPDALRYIPRPRVVYVGAIAAWFDFELVVELARRMTDLNFVLFGPWASGIRAPSAYPNNIHILGPIEYEKVPDVLAYSDVGLVPFRDCELVQGVSPIKVYEYLAARLPVVSLRWKELDRESLPIFMASSASEFDRGIRDALQMNLEQRERLRIFAQSCSWEQRLERILERIGMSLRDDN